MKKGFTLIELLVVVLIIGILAAVALPQYQKAVAKARATEAKMSLKALVEAVDLYILESGETPTSLNDLTVTGPTSPHFRYDLLNCGAKGTLGCVVWAFFKTDETFAIYTETKNYDTGGSYYGLYTLTKEANTSHAGPVSDVATCTKYGGTMLDDGYGYVTCVI